MRIVVQAINASPPPAFKTGYFARIRVPRDDETPLQQLAIFAGADVDDPNVLTFLVEPTDYADWPADANVLELGDGINIGRFDTALRCFFTMERIPAARLDPVLCLPMDFNVPAHGSLSPTLLAHSDHGTTIRLGCKTLPPRSLDDFDPKLVKCRIELKKVNFFLSSWRVSTLVHTSRTSVSVTDMPTPPES